MLLLDETILFAGDSLLGNGLELKSLGADEACYRAQVLPYIKDLDSEILVCPGHGEVSTLRNLWYKIEEYIG